MLTQHTDFAAQVFFVAPRANDLLEFGAVGRDDSGTLAPDLPPPAIDSASILTNGIQDITNSLVETFRLNDVLQMILETMLRALNCRRVVFCLRDARTGQRLGLAAIAQLKRDPLHRHGCAGIGKPAGGLEALAAS